MIDNVNVQRIRVFIPWDYLLEEEELLECEPLERELLELELECELLEECELPL